MSRMKVTSYRGGKKAKGHLQGFEEGGEFHPIRDSSGYSNRKAGEKKPKSRKKKR